MSERRLRNAAAPQVAVVESADELLDVVGAGTPNIEIRQHLDLRVGDGRIVHDDYESRTPVLSTIPLTVRAIRVRPQTHHRLMITPPAIRPAVAAIFQACVSNMVTAASCSDPFSQSLRSDQPSDDSSTQGMSWVRV